MITKKDILNSPHRKWDDESRLYNSILIIPTGRKHDSGFMYIAIVGVYVENSEQKFEICGECDDISTFFKPVVLGEDYEYASVRMDCYYPNGVLRYHGDGKFWISCALSSMDIKFIPNKK